MIKSVHLPAPCQGEEAVTDRVCRELSFQRLPPSLLPLSSVCLLLLRVTCNSYLVFSVKPFSLMPRRKSPPRHRLGSGYQRSKTGGPAGGRVDPQDGKMENNAGDCERTERGAGPLSRKESCGSETLWVSVGSRACRQIASEAETSEAGRAGGRARLTGDGGQRDGGPSPSAYN